MPVRVHELAKELKISAFALRKHLSDLGVTTKNHMSLVDEDVAERIRLKYNEQIDAEKRAERDRKRLVDLKHAAKHKTELPVEPIPEVRTDKLPTPVSAKEKPVSKPDTAPAPAPEPQESPVSPEPTAVMDSSSNTEPTKSLFEGMRIIEIKPQPPRGQQRRPKSYLETQRSTDRPPKKLYERSPRPEAPKRPDGKKPDDYTKPISTLGPKAAIPATEAGVKEADSKKFGKVKISHEELGEKSKHRKALLKTAKKGKNLVAEVTEIDEAEISRNIKKTLLKSSKRKKYHRDAQVVSDRGANEVVISEYTSVNELAKIISVPPSEIISKFFMMGQLVTINQRLDKDSLEMICDEYKLDFKFEDEFGADIISQKTTTYNDVDAITRPPIVTIMGHVDHGKTSILDYIRNTNIVAGESGSITQHIGAYQIEINKHKITFIDTPGHEAFTAMRARGANATDIAVIVVSATEGVKPQTLEAIDHAKAANVPIIVAINKVDLPETNMDKVIAQLLDNGVYLEQYGGEVPWCRTSVVTGEGILNLIELILLTAEIQELKSKWDVPAKAVVIEAKIDSKTGAVVTILMQEGSLKKGDIVVCGATYGRIRKMENERGGEIKDLYPSDVGRIYGLSTVPKAGDMLNQVETEKTARSISTERHQIRMEREKYQSKTSLQNLFARIKEEKIGEVRIIVKADTDGSVEAIADSFFKLSNNEVIVNIIHKNVGGINEDDVNLATASDAIIIGFHVRASHQARKLAEDQNVDIRLYQVIYAAIDDVRKALEGMLKPEFEEVVIGSAIVRQVFKIKKVGVIAGCYIERGSILRQCKVRLFRNDVLLHEGNLASLKHFQNEVSEIKAGNECGMALDRWQDIKEDDLLECYVIKQTVRKFT